MLNYSDLDPEKSAFVFELDDVLYPHQDYLLQVYYLFANFLEYTETKPQANELTAFLKNMYLNQGSIDLFEKAAKTFGINEKYKENFDRLHVSAQLPLPLLLYPEVLTLLKSIKNDSKAIYILTKGNPLMQLNKLKHIQWEGLDSELRVYFYDELKLKSKLEPFVYLLTENNLDINNVLMIGSSREDDENAKSLSVDYLDISLLFY